MRVKRCTAFSLSILTHIKFSSSFQPKPWNGPPGALKGYVRPLPLLCQRDPVNDPSAAPASQRSPGMIRSMFPSFPWRRLPNWLTYIRCIAIPALCYVFYLPNQQVSAGLLFGFASFTDWLDGYLARRWDVSTSFGAFLDPVADKLMVATALILLSGHYGASVALPTAVILNREIAVSALREWMAQLGERDSVQVGFQGKVKTALTMVAVTILLMIPRTDQSARGNLPFALSLGMLYACAVITVTSGSVYFREAAPRFFPK